MRFDGKVVLVTGAARGIGAATALAFAKEGADVIVNDISDAQPVVDEITQMGRRSKHEPADVSDYEQVEAMVARTVSEFGRLDVMVANAAYSDRGPFVELPMESIHRTVDVTMWGVLYCLRAAARAMIARGRGGNILVTGSPHALVPTADSMPYNMAKAAVDHLARTAATELFQHRIRVNIVHPGWVNTPGERKFFDEETLAETGAQLPWKRLARPDEIARGMLFLADPDSEYITGSTLTIDGGIQLPWSQII